MCCLTKYTQLLSFYFLQIRIYSSLDFYIVWGRSSVLLASSQKPIWVRTTYYINHCFSAFVLIIPLLTGILLTGLSSFFKENIYLYGSSGFQLQHAGSFSVAYELFVLACGIQFPGQRLNPDPLHQKCVSQPLENQGSP